MQTGADFPSPGTARHSPPRPLGQAPGRPWFPAHPPWPPLHKGGKGLIARQYRANHREQTTNDGQRSQGPLTKVKRPRPSKTTDNGQLTTDKGRQLTTDDGQRRPRTNKTTDHGQLTTDYPDNLEINVTSGKKSAITMKPTMPPRITIMMGSSRLTKLSTAVSTSSS